MINRNNVLQRRCFAGTISDLSQDLIKRTTARSYFSKTIKKDNILTMVLFQVNYAFILHAGLLMETLGTHGRRATRISNMPTITLIKTVILVPSLHSKWSSLVRIFLVNTCPFLIRKPYLCLNLNILKIKLEIRINIFLKFYLLIFFNGLFSYI